MTAPRMRIAIFWNYLFHYRVPFYNRLAREPGVELTVFHGGTEPHQPGHEPPAEAGHAFRSVQVTTYEQPLFGAAIYFQSGMWKDLWRRRYDVIVCEGNFGILSNVLIALYAKLTSTRIFYWTGGWERKVISGFPARLRRWFIRLTAHLADGYLCYGTSARAFLMRYGVDPALCQVVQNTIDTDAIQATHERSRVQAARARDTYRLAGKLVILSVGVLIPRKRHDLLIEAFHIVRSRRDDVALVLVGDGAERDRLHDMVRTRGIPDVHFAGEVIADAGSYFALADVFVLPALGGLAINQAMAYGLPVICSEGDGTEKDLVIPGQTGLLFRPGDVHNLADKVMELLGSHAERRAMGEGARAHLYRVASMPAMVSRFLTAVGAPG
jgi:glycosyltransferase involved in cell wall biosynthesis